MKIVQIQTINDKRVIIEKEVIGSFPFSVTVNGTLINTYKDIDKAKKAFETLVSLYKIKIRRDKA